MKPLLTPALLLALAGCSAQKAPESAAPPAAPAAPAPEAIGIANPASEHCVKLGGKLEIRSETGGQVGYCHLPDGRVVEEWALFRESRGK